jgi:regulator of sirC expression with transglutaminase-like and TPR domain
MKADARERFAEMARRGDSAIDLAEAALLIAAEAYPDLDVQHYLCTIDALADEARTRLHERATADEIVGRLNDFLFIEKGFSGNVEDYYDRRNSFLNEVLERRTGIPISLAVLYMEIGRRLGLPLRGVSFPGHFLVKYERSEPIIIDPFYGRVISEGECQIRLEGVLGKTARFDRRYLRSATAREILVRMLANLKQIYANAGEIESTLACCDRIILLVPDSPHALLERGILYQRLECYGAAQADLQKFLDLEPQDERAEDVRALLVEINERVRQIH